MLNVENVNLTYNNQKILHSISLTIAPEQIICLLGKSGSGKTTLLRCIAQLEQSYTGTISFNNKNLSGYNLQEKASLIGFVFQQFHLFPHLSVLENCIQPLKIVQKYTQENALEAAYTMLNKLQIKHLAHAYPAQLSGGEQQRVALSRALVLNPKIICLDEPTSALDPENTAVLFSYLKELCNSGITVILATQDMSFASLAHDHIYFMDQGQIVEHVDTKKTTPLQENSKIKQFLRY